MIHQSMRYGNKPRSDETEPTKINNSLMRQKQEEDRKRGRGRGRGQGQVGTSGRGYEAENLGHGRDRGQW